VKTLEVDLGARSYPILIGSGVLGIKSAVTKHVRRGDVLLVSNTTVQPLYAEPLLRALSAHRVVQATLPDGERHKTLANISRLLDVLVANRFNRDCTIIALGGGVVGDMAGFAAACYQRGVDYVQVPTTLLAQVDSSVGGKTGVNHPGGKNLIGAFHQPVAVLADTDTLGSLPDRELRAGLAEVIKYGLIHDAALFDWLEASLDKLLARDARALTHAIARSCEIKAEIVGRDEREQGERALLNYGHTFGHAIEAATGYTEWLHGEAVGTGMMMAASLANELGQLSGPERDRICALIERAGLPVRVRGVTPMQMLDNMRIDKKVKQGQIRFVLLQRIGRACVTSDYGEAALSRAMSAHLG
jgi:3-dehydroquinate synthase